MIVSDSTYYYYCFSIQQLVVRSTNNTCTTVVLLGHTLLAKAQNVAVEEDMRQILTMVLAPSFSTTVLYVHTRQRSAVQQDTVNWKYSVEKRRDAPADTSIPALTHTLHNSTTVRWTEERTRVHTTVSLYT